MQSQAEPGKWSEEMLGLEGWAVGLSYFAYFIIYIIYFIMWVCDGGVSSVAEDMLSMYKAFYDQQSAQNFSKFNLNF